MEHARQPTRVRRRLTIVNEDAAGLDVGATFHVVAIPADRDAEPVRTFQSFTADLHALADWLQSVGIRTIAMESTGVYWIPVYEILEQRGFEVLLVNARDTRNVPGRKTDVNDAQWLQQLHQHGLLRGSFRPRPDIARLRAYLRHRERLLDYAASHIQHMQKALMQMNVQLHHVVTDITGVTGMHILRAIVAGNHDPAALAEFRDRRCKASQATIAAALTGNYREEHLFALRQSLELYDFHRTQIAACDAQIEATLTQLNRDREAPAQPLPAVRHQGGTQRAPVRGAIRALHATRRRPLAGARLRSVHGLAPRRRVRERHDQVAHSEALHVVALPRSGEQDLGWPGAQLENPAVGQPCQRAPAHRGRQRGPHPYRPRGVLPPPRQSHRKSQGGDGHGAQAGGALLQQSPLRHAVR
jgi:transposase